MSHSESSEAVTPHTHPGTVVVLSVLMDFSICLRMTLSNNYVSIKCSHYSKPNFFCHWTPFIPVYHEQTSRSDPVMSSLLLLSSTFSHLPATNILYKSILVKGHLLSPIFDYLYFLSSKWIIKSAQCLMQFTPFKRWHNIISSPTRLQILYSVEVFSV